MLFLTLWLVTYHQLALAQLIQRRKIIYSIKITFPNRTMSTFTQIITFTTQWLTQIFNKTTCSLFLASSSNKVFLFHLKTVLWSVLCNQILIKVAARTEKQLNSINDFLLLWNIILASFNRFVNYMLHLTATKKCLIFVWRSRRAEMKRSCQ